MIDVLNETEHDVDGTELVACARYVMARMNVHPLSLIHISEPTRRS